MMPDLLQNPELRPIEKHELSWLKAADRATGLFDVSITGRVFIVTAFSQSWVCPSASSALSAYIRTCLVDVGSEINVGAVSFVDTAL